MLTTNMKNHTGNAFQLISNTLFIDGSEESALFHACDLSMENLAQFLAFLDEMHDSQYPALFYLCDVRGYSMEDAMGKLEDVTIYNGRLEDAAEELFDECYAHEIPEHLRNYIDYEQFALDCQLGGDMFEFDFAGNPYTVSNAAYL